MAAECWWPGDISSQGISNLDIDQVIPVERVKITSLENDSTKVLGKQKLSTILDVKIRQVANTEEYSGSHLNIKMSSYQYGDSHVNDKTVSRPSYL